jgi:hypothetical protein
MVDFWLIPTVLQMVLFGIIGGVAATQTGPGPQWVGLLAMGGSWALALVLLAYYLLKDGFFSGRSIGKVASGVQAIDVASGRPIGVGKSALRNLIFYIPVFVSLPLQVLFPLGRPGVVSPAMARTIFVLIMVMSILNLGIFLFELALMYRAPLMRRLGDRIGGTRVVDYGKRLEGRRRRWRAKWAKTLGRVQGLSPGEALEVTLPGA